MSGGASSRLAEASHHLGKVLERRFTLAQVAPRALHRRPLVLWLRRTPRSARLAQKAATIHAQEDASNYPIADVIASQNTVESPKNWCGPCTITCSLRKCPSESNVSTNELNPTSLSKMLLWDV